MKLVDKWNVLQQQLSIKEQEFIKTIYPEQIQSFYMVEYGRLHTCTVKKYYYKFSFPIFSNANKVTRKDVERLENDFKNMSAMKADDIYINYEYKTSYPNGNGNCSSSISAKEILKENNERFFMNLEEGERKEKEVREQIEKRKAFFEQHKKDKSYDYAANGYQFLGWQNGWKYVYVDEHGEITTDRTKSKSTKYLTTDYPEYGKCRDQKHETVSVQHDRRGSENTVSCPICKIYWKYDCSD